MEAHLREYIAESKGVLETFFDGIKPACLLILGSGLNFYADTLTNKRYLDFKDVPHMHVSSADGHVGRYVLGQVEGNDSWILCMQGRIHGYEGCSAMQVAFPVWIAQAAGIDTMFTTNAAGALNPSFNVGSFCVMTDHINMTGRNPVAGMEPHRMAQRFVPMLNAYDSELRQRLLACAEETNVEVFQGVYLGVFGPSFETPAEIKMFAAWGADTVAMSVCEEVIAARHVGMRVVGMSLISNMGCGIEGSSPSSEEVTEIAIKSEANFKRLMDAFLVTL